MALAAAALLVHLQEASAQNIGINVNGAAPHASALLDIDVSAITGTKRGLLIPRMTGAQRAAITAPATSLLVFDNTANAFFHWDGSAWVPLLSGNSGWTLQGNAVTSAHFLGTTNNEPLRIRANNLSAGLIDQSPFTGNLFLGLQAGANNTGQDNTILGNTAGTANTSGSQNTMLGSEAGLNNVTGSYNTLLGWAAAYQSNASNYNTCIGSISGGQLSSGSENTFLGWSSGSNISSGSNNTMLGNATGAWPTNTNSTAIGWRAYASQSNSMVLGSVAGVNGASSSVNVGIGNNAPQDRLHVTGSIRMEDGNQATNRVMVSNAGGTASWQALTPAITNAWSLSGNTGTGAEYLGTNNAQPLRFASSGIERMRISPAGDIIAGGTATPFGFDLFSAVSSGGLTYPMNGYAYSTGSGVYGDTRPGHSGTGAGVEGVSFSNGFGIDYSPGVRGVFAGNTTNNIAAGVLGVNLAPTSLPFGGTGVHGANNSTFGTGRLGVLGTHNPTAWGVGVYGIGFGGGIIVGNFDIGVCGAVSASFAYAGYFNGNQAATGTKSASVPTRQGNQLIYCMESPEIWFEDVGGGQLTAGQAEIALDQLFLETVQIDEQHPLRVFVQLEGDCQGVFINKDTDSFTVRELQGGTSNTAFSYRVMAKRKHYADHRFGHDPVYGDKDSNPYFSDVEPTPVAPAAYSTWRDRLRKEWKQPPMPPGFIGPDALMEQGANRVNMKATATTGR
jgi:hypothetical protein